MLNFDEDEELSASAATPASLPTSLLYCGETAANLRSDHNVIQIVVKREIFPQVKFMLGKEVRWSSHKNSLCQKMAGWCHIEEERRDEWWRRASSILLKSIAQQRGNRMTSMKKAFMGKCTDSVATYCLL